MTRCYRWLVGALTVVTLAIGSWAATALADAPPGRYTFPASGTVYDTRTQLTWQQAVDPGTYNWAAAVTYCAELSLAGSGWRLPTKLELESIVDDTRNNPALDPIAFPTNSDSIWTSTPDAGDSSRTWYVLFNTGNSSTNGRTSAIRVRCVR